MYISKNNKISFALDKTMFGYIQEQYIKSNMNEQIELFIKIVTILLQVVS